MSKKKSVIYQAPLHFPPDNAESGIYHEYFNYETKYREEYGRKVVVFMQVGAFFEVYGYKSNGAINPLMEEFAELCQLNISEKKATYKQQQIVMAGFRDFTLDKYVSRLVDLGYTVPVFVQEKRGKDIVRNLHQIYSAGTYLSCDTDSSPQITNHIMCIWIDLFLNRGSSRELIVYGAASVNIFTGKMSMFQHETSFFMNTSTFDELERYISTILPSEVILIHPFDDKQKQQVLQLSGIVCQTIHSIHNGNEKNSKVANCKSQKYIKEILSTFFGAEAYNACSEFQSNIMATQSLCYLLNYVQEHNSDLVRKVSMPTFENSSERIILANHTLSQLNILSDSNSTIGKLGSVLSFLNKCVTPMGKRKFREQLLTPTMDQVWLQREYNMITRFMVSKKVQASDNIIDITRKQLVSIRDMEKLCRQLLLKKMYPSSIAHLHKSCVIIHDLFLTLQSYEYDDVCDYLCSVAVPDISLSITQFLESQLNIELCKQQNSISQFDVNIIQPGINKELDDCVKKNNINAENLEKIRTYFNELMRKNEKTIDTDYVKIHETDKSGCSLQITAKRSQTLKTLIQNSSQEPVLIHETCSFRLQDVKFTKTSATAMTIEFPVLTKLCADLLYGKDHISSLVAKSYISILESLETNYFKQLENLSGFVTNIDVLQSKTYAAREYNYCCPTIDSSAIKSYVNITQLRHCLIEQIQENEIYVTNDIYLGDCIVNGILLYGTNAVGKTSLIRSIGVSVIMAQAGMFVPATTFIYKPYSAIFSRIVGNDNLFKGLSTFAVEMTELRMILKMADENSLILGDELCSGTETESALSIFAAGLIQLHNKRSSFIFATHFHEIVNYDEINELSTLVLKHMSVSYDREKDRLLYDRKLKDGSGPRTYGLEVCKSLYLENEFLDLATTLRNKYFPESCGILSQNTTRYNAKKIRILCEVCKQRKSDEVHHKVPQKDADENGFIGSFHKNHKANLLSVCEKCHLEIHKE